jgi:hypothetical protein
MSHTQVIQLGYPSGAIWFKMLSEGQSMKPFLQLNLNDHREKAEEANLPKPESTEPESEEARKRLNRLANIAAHKAASQYRRGNTGLFSK